MAKRFDIHEWQAKQRLAEQEEFTPDLEDDELKRGAIRQMMDKEKGGKEGPPYISATQLFDNVIEGLETSGPYQDDIMFSKKRALEIIEMAIDIEESEISPEAALDQAMEKEDELDEQKTPQDVPQGTLNNTITDLAKMYSYGEILDSLKVFYTDHDELPFAEMAKKHAKEFRDFLDSKDDELDEANMTGTGASFNAGDGAGYASPNAFAKKGKWKRKNEKYEE